jgi:hypothetical protein
MLGVSLLFLTVRSPAAVTTYCCDQAAEDAYITALATLVPSASVVHESFEAGPWASIRSPTFQPTVTNLGIIWTQPDDGLTTNNARSVDGDYQMYTFDAVFGHTEPDGYTLTGDGLNLHGVGGWFRGTGTKLSFIVDGDPDRVDFTGEQATVTDWTFLGFIDTVPFSSLEIVRTDEIGNETNWFWSDDFNIATRPASVADDFDGDGKSDILWRNSSTGQNWLYEMNGATIANSAGVNTVPIAWEIVGDGDYNGDGKSDILWRNSSTGQNWLYEMNGATIANSAGVNTVPIAWEIVGDGDYNGDGNADILWRHSSTGQNWLYEMNGATIANSAGVNTISDTNWKIINTR